MSNLYDQARETILRIDSECRFEAQELGGSGVYFELDQNLKDYFAKFGALKVNIEGWCNELEFVPLSKLDYWYRLHAFTEKGWFKKALVRNPNWNPQYIPIVFEGSDPFVYSLSDKKVYHVVHDFNYADPSFAFPSLEHMAISLSIVSETLTDSHANGIWFTSEDEREKQDEYLVKIREQLGNVPLEGFEIDQVLEIAGMSDPN